MKTFANPTSSKVDWSVWMEHCSNSLNPVMNHSNSELPSDNEEKFESIKESDNGEKIRVQMTMDSQGDLYRAIKNELKISAINNFVQQLLIF